MKLVSIVGARSQLVKAAVVSRALRREHQEILVYAGRSDEDMSGGSFKELEFPVADFTLEIDSVGHGAQTGAMLIEIEKVLLREKPDWVLVYGDSNATLAGALTAVKLHIPVVHVGAGERSFNRAMPEEINRIIVDRVSALLLCPSRAAMDNLAREGVTRGVYIIGDLIYDTLLYALARARPSPPMTNSRIR